MAGYDGSGDRWSQMWSDGPARRSKRLRRQRDHRGPRPIVGMAGSPLHARGKTVASAMMMRHGPVGIGRHLVGIAVAVHGSGTFQPRCRGGHRQAFLRMHRRRRQQRRHQQAQQKASATEHGGRLRSSLCRCHYEADGIRARKRPAGAAPAGLRPAGGSGFRRSGRSCCGDASPRRSGRSPRSSSPRLLVRERPKA